MIASLYFTYICQNTLRALDTNINMEAWVGVCVCMCVCVCVCQIYMITHTYVVISTNLKKII